MRKTVAVVGCGGMGFKHALNCRDIDGVQLISVCDVDSEKGTELSKRTGATFYQDFDKMIAMEKLDALIITTPPIYRKEFIQKAVGKNINIFVEKPLSISKELGKEFCDLVESKPIIHSVGFHLRYAPITDEVRNILDGHEVTQIRTVTATSYYVDMDMPRWFLQKRFSGGPLFEQSLHLLDLSRYLFGEIININGVGKHLLRSNPLFDFDIDEDLDSEDTIILNSEFANGILGVHSESCANLKFRWELEILGPTISILVDYANNTITGSILDGDKIENVNINQLDADWHKIELDCFFKDINLRVNSPEFRVRSDFFDAQRTVSLMTKALKSLRDKL